jgi:hypothetical protein
VRRRHAGQTYLSPPWADPMDEAWGHSNSYAWPGWAVDGSG